MGNLMGDGPNGNTICTKLLAKDILMEFDQSIDAVLPCHFDGISHQLKIGVIKLSLPGLYSRPHDSQPDPVDAFGLEKLHVGLIEGRMIGGNF
jgi:hypothetical protein